MIRNSRLMNRYGPGGKAGLVSGIAKAFARTSASFMRLSCSGDARSRPVSFAASVGEVEGEHTFQMARPLKHLLMPQRANGVVVSSAPVILHRETGELVVLRVAFVVLRAVDEVHDVVDIRVGGRPEKLRLLARFQIVGQLPQKSREYVSHSLKPLELVRVQARPARVLDFFLPRRNLGEVAGKLASRAPEVDLERERVLALAVLEDPLQRGV